jgi:thiamine-phosphate pyrophosphorylase
MTASLTESARRLKWRLVAISDPRGGDPLRLAARLPAGAWLIFRHYDHPDRSVLAARLAGLCRSRRIALLIAGDFALAIKLGTGLHLQDRPLAEPARIRLWHRRRRLLTLAAHDAAGLRRAAGLGADSALLSPVFATASHPGAKALGLIALRRLSGRATLPVIALGGVDPDRVPTLARLKLAGIAAITALHARSDATPGSAG